MAGKLFIRTFGCQMNEYDSEKISGVLARAEGLTPSASAEDATRIIRMIGRENARRVYGLRPADG